MQQRVKKNDGNDGDEDEDRKEEELSSNRRY